MRQRALLLLSLAIATLALTPSVANAAPVVTHAHLEFAIPIDECGLTTLDLSIDKTSIVNVGANVTTFTTVDRGYAVDRGTGEEFRFLDRATQKVILRIDGASVNTAARTLVITGSSGTTLLVRALVHTTTSSDGTTASETNLQFVKCL